MLFKKFCRGLINELMKDMAGLVNSLSLNTLTFQPIDHYQEGKSDMKLPAELKSPNKGVINIKNNTQKCFLWCHVRHINLVKIHPKKILHGKIKKNLLIVLIMMELNYPV